MKKIVSQDTRNKISEKMKGRFVSKETREKMGLAHRGTTYKWNKPSPLKGRKISAEHAAKLTLISRRKRNPLSEGGSNDYENLGIACPKCNMTKKDKTVEEYLNYLNKRRNGK